MINTKFYTLKAEHLVEEGEYHTAIEHCHTVLAMNDNDSNARLIAGYCFYMLEQYKKALGYFERCVPLVHKSSKNWRAYIKCLIHNDQINDARSEFVKATTKFKNSSELSNAYGCFLVTLGEYELALKWLIKANTQGIKSDVLLFNRATCYFHLDMLSKAVTDLTKIELINTDQLEAIFLLGDTYFKLEQYQKAIDTYSRILEFNFKNRKALYGRLMARLKTATIGKPKFDQEAAQRDADKLLPYAEEFFNSALNGKDRDILQLIVGEKGELDIVFEK